MTTKYEAMRNVLNQMIHHLLRSGADKEGRELVEKALDVNAMPEDKPETLPEPGTTEYGSLVNKASKEADQCFSIHAERFKWLCKFEQTFRALAPQPVAQQPAQAICELCGGRGEIGGHVGQTPEQFDYVTEPCPDCIGTGEQPAHTLAPRLANLIREAADALDDLSPRQTPENSAARAIAQDLRVWLKQ